MSDFAGPENSKLSEIDALNALNARLEYALPAYSRSSALMSCAQGSCAEESSKGSQEGQNSDFPGFPFPPYPIQIGFMKELYTCLESRCIGLLESPTGEID